MIDIKKIQNGYWWNSVGKHDSLVAGKNTLEELTIQITDRCNMNCPKCNKLNFTFEDMKKDDVIRVIEEACELGLKHIHFTGGEPTLHKDYPEMIRVAKEHNLRIDMSTNGMFDYEKAKKIVGAGIDSINVSWDYIDKEPECMKFISEFDTKVFVNHMVIPANYKELPEFLEFIAKKDFIVDVQLMPPRGDATKFTKEELLDFNQNIAQKAFDVSTDRFLMVAFKVLDILADEDADKGIYHDKIKWPCHRSKVEIRVGGKGFATCTYLYRDGHITCGLDKSVKEAFELCKKDCTSIPPMPKMCDYSCSPEVCYFNLFVEQSI